MPAARPGASRPTAASAAPRPSAWLHAGSPVESSWPAYSGSANASARATSSRSAPESPSASAPSAAAPLCGCSCTTVTMRYFTVHGLAHGMAAQARAAAACHRRRSLAQGAGRPAFPPVLGQAAPAGAAVSRREGVQRRPRHPDHRRDARGDRGAGLPSGAGARTGLVRGLARHRALPGRLPRAAQGDRRGRRGARVGRRPRGRGDARRTGGDLVGCRGARSVHQRGDPRVRAQARHGERRRRRPAAAARGHGRARLGGGVPGGLRRFLRRARARPGHLARPVRGRASVGILRGRHGGVFRAPARNPAALSCGLRAAQALLPAGSGRNIWPMNALEIYERLTERRTRFLRVDELCRRAAETGVLPSKEELEQEARLAQRDKQGLEKKQGEFLAQILGDPVAGTHLCHAMLLPLASSAKAFADFDARGEIELRGARLQRVGKAAVLTMANPRYLNAEDESTLEGMETAVDLALLDPKTEVCVLRGAAVAHPKHAGRRIFGAGINLTHLYEGRIRYLWYLIRDLGFVNKFYRGLAKPDASPEIDSVEKLWI